MLPRKNWAFASVLALTGLATAGSTPARASIVIPITNGSFETPVVTGGNVTFTVTGFGQGADTGIQQGGQIGAPAAEDGSQIAFLGNNNNFTNLYQDIAGAGQGDPTVTSYTLTLGLAIRTVDPTTNGTINVGIQDVQAGNSSSVFVTPVLRAGLTTSGFQDFSTSLPANIVNPGDAIRVFLDKTAGNSLIVTDNWRLVANQVPEPASFGLLGACGLVAVRRRRRRRGR